MTFARLLWRNLRYHWRSNLAVLFGVALGTTVLTGALLVGDSLRGSLRAMALDRLGWVEEAMLPRRFVQHLVGVSNKGQRDVGVMNLQGIATNSPRTQVASRVQIWAVGSNFWPDGPPDSWNTDSPAVLVNANLALHLGIAAGDEIRVGIHGLEAIPRESLLGRRKSDDLFKFITFRVHRVMSGSEMSDFSLRPGVEPVLNVFVPLATMQEKLGLRNQVNVVLHRDDWPRPQGVSRYTVASPKLSTWNVRLRDSKERAESFFRYLDPRNDGDAMKKARWNGRVPDELGRLAANNVLTQADFAKFFAEQRGYLTLESSRMLLEPAVERAVVKVVANPKSDASIVRRVMVYLADTIKTGAAEIPYALVAGVDTAKSSDSPPADDEIDLMVWPGAPWNAKPGDPVTVTYFSPDPKNHLEKKDAQFRLRKLIPLEGTYDDPDLTPEFPGVTDKLDMAGWENPPFPYNPRRVKPADEEYWKRYRATPRAYVSLATAQRLWGGRFGNTTSFHLNIQKESDFESRLLSELRTSQAELFQFQPVQAQAEQSANGPNDFGMLFLAFSFFLIVSALLLVGLLVRLGMDRRANEMGLLAATGWTHRSIARLLMSEGLLLILVGALLGLAGAGFYADAMLRYLARNWPGSSSLSFLSLHVTPTSLAIGFLASMFVSAIALWLSLRHIRRLSPRELISGQTSAHQLSPPGRLSWWLNYGMLGVGLTMLLAVNTVSFVGEGRIFLFFAMGFVFLVAWISASWRLLKSPSMLKLSERPNIVLLGFRNACRNPLRSVLTVGLLASATFLIIAVEAFHKETHNDFDQRTGGSGGFALFAESDIPIYQDLNQPKTREDLGLDEAKASKLANTQILALRVQSGDDTSCLNLGKPLQPRVMGVSDDLISRQGFHFANSHEPSTNPWRLLNKEHEDDAIPAILDKNTAMWILKVGVGDTVTVNDENQRPAKLRVVGLLSESLFQSEILIGERDFLKLYPRHEGFSFLLVDCQKEDPVEIRTILDGALAEQGWSVRPTRDRVQAFLAVENTYLATFQALGGLGLVLGAIGLAIVLMRGVWERRAELALLRAVGFEGRLLIGLVFAENAFLLLLGLAIGVGSAVVAVLPHLEGSNGLNLAIRIAGLLIMVLAVGLASGLAAVLSSLRTPVLTALRRE